MAFAMPALNLLVEFRLGNATANVTWKAAAATNASMAIGILPKKTRMVAKNAAVI